MTEGARKKGLYPFWSFAKTSKKEAKEIPSTRQCLAKKPREVRTEMKRGVIGGWEGHLLKV